MHKQIKLSLDGIQHHMDSINQWIDKEIEKSTMKYQWSNAIKLNGFLVFCGKIAFKWKLKTQSNICNNKIEIVPFNLYKSALNFIIFLLQ